MAQVNIQSRNFEVDAELRQHVGEKIDGLDKHWPRGGETSVRLEAERGRYLAEVTLVSSGLVTRGEERAGNARQAFDNAIAKLESQLIRYKEKATARKRRHDNRDDVAGTVLNPTRPDTTTAAATEPVTAEEHENGSHDLHSDNGQPVRVKRFALKPMAAEEAALQMDLLGHNFFVFRDADSNQVSVVYRREGGGFGLIEPIAD